MLFCLLPEKGRINSEVKKEMKMLVTKFSSGKYHNEGELFAEAISSDNVKLMGEMIALQALRTVIKHDFKVADELYTGLIKDLHHMNEAGYIISEGYDCAQRAICFLWQYAGRNVHELYGKDRRGGAITIKLACYREVGRYITGLRRKSAHVEYSDFTEHEELTIEPAYCFGEEEQECCKADAIVSAMKLTETELAVLRCYVNGMVQSEVMAELGIGRGAVNNKKANIRKKYCACFGAL